MTHNFCVRAPVPPAAPAPTSPRNPEEPSAGPADSSPAERPRPDQDMLQSQKMGKGEAGALVEESEARKEEKMKCVLKTMAETAGPTLCSGQHLFPQPRLLVCSPDLYVLLLHQQLSCEV
nr:uncharacterized protein LOC110147711 [Odocoileus virginianus texanus]